MRSKQYCRARAPSRAPARSVATRRSYSDVARVAVSERSRRARRHRTRDAPRTAAAMSATARLGARPCRRTGGGGPPSARQRACAARPLRRPRACPPCTSASPCPCRRARRRPDGPPTRASQSCSSCSRESSTPRRGDSSWHRCHRLWSDAPTGLPRCRTATTLGDDALSRAATEPSDSRDHQPSVPCALQRVSCALRRRCAGLLPVGFPV
mmetsp:Transcript_20287/g.81029  ORF Transcript_20287/g.81029 Transcript_20287/m.81029 type:complete len:211 (-) Transcript_20287:5-637(-)